MEKYERNATNEKDEQGYSLTWSVKRGSELRNARLAHIVLMVTMVLDKDDRSMNSSEPFSEIYNVRLGRESIQMIYRNLLKSRSSGVVIWHRVPLFAVSRIRRANRGVNWASLWSVNLGIVYCRERKRGRGCLDSKLLPIAASSSLESS